MIRIEGIPIVAAALAEAQAKKGTNATGQHQVSGEMGTVRTEATTATPAASRENAMATAA